MSNEELQEFNNVEYHTNQINIYYNQMVELGGWSNMTEVEVGAYIKEHRADISLEIQQCNDAMELHAYIRDSFDLEAASNSHYPNYRYYFFDMLMFIIKHRTTLPQELVFKTVQWVEYRVANN